MTLCRVLVTVSRCERERAILLVDLDSGSATELLPYIGGLCAAGEWLHVARLEGDRTRIETYDREGLVWMRRVRDCVDTHGITPYGDGLAVCSTGTNEVIFLDAHGAEAGRWSPDARAEGDSWHINSLATRQGRLYTTCFGRFDRFRGWAGRIERSGLLIEVGSGRTILSGLSAPHDPCPVAGGWILNDAARSATVFCAEDGRRRVIFHTPGFARGLEVLPECYIIGSSGHRLGPRPDTGATLAVVERRTHAVIRTIDLPYREVGHILAAPSAEVLSAVRRDAQAGWHGLSPRRGAIPPPDRAGSIEALGPPRRARADSDARVLPVRVTNRGGCAWSSGDEPPVFASYQVLHRAGGALLREGCRTYLPLPVQPGRSLTFDLRLDPTVDDFGDEAALRITLIQEGVAWWEATERWTPAVVDPVAEPGAGASSRSSASVWPGPKAPAIAVCGPAPRPAAPATQTSR